MKTLFSGLLLALVVSHASAQKAPVKFGDVPLEDLQMKRYPLDSSASAVVLADYGQSTLEFDQTNGFFLLFERTTRIKILTKEGLDEANFTIPLYHNGSADEKVSGLKTATYNLENGKVVETRGKSDNVFKEKYDANVDLMKVTLPAVKEGSVVEITYKVNSDFFVNLQDWEFQRTIPVRLSEYRANIPEYFSYDKYMQGYLTLFVNEQKEEASSITFNNKERSGGNVSTTTYSQDKLDFRQIRHRWVVKDAPAFKVEPFLTTYRDYISKINFELSYIKYPNQPIKPYLGTWGEICEKLNTDEDFGGEVRGNGFLKKYVEEATAKATTPEEKVIALHKFVADRMTWNGESRKYTASSLKKVFEEGKGNSAEINLLLASMLEKAELEAYPVLISTRDHGFVRESVAILDQFNYAICAVKLNDKVMLLDATDNLLPSGVLPERCLNGQGLLVSKAGPQWVALKAPKSRKVVSANLVVSQNGGLKGSFKVDQSGYYARKSRKEYFASGEKDYVKNVFDEHTWQIDKSTFQNHKDVTQVFKEEYDVTLEEGGADAIDVIYLDVVSLSRDKENPFKAEKREYPVDFGSPYEEMYLARIVIPEGYVADEIPKPKILLLPENSAKYSYNITQFGNTLNVASQLQVNRSLFTQDEYVHLREFYAQMVAKQAEQIVLKKKQ
ncbi:DUF3857 domain-containing protein [Chryseolinea lacunae]|uniref:DUF3857 domain-containing protein n=1 Tax=Chryseolinea lacunae TaxID=2801331 RepID=A0ABS1KU14_9BACT|nr:DUF3857 domain-containing protein [Chryseolinea lacunae]MBL0741816.1 DUF3857 domain-containing protein [Chryseolinea lacunae]